MERAESCIPRRSKGTRDGGNTPDTTPLPGTRALPYIHFIKTQPGA